MKINLETGELFTDSGHFLKRLNCPKNIKSSQLIRSENKELSCASCNETIFPTEGLKDEELIEILQIFPQQCFKVNLNQSNLSIIRNE